MNPLFRAMGGGPFGNIQAIIGQIGQFRQNSPLLPPRDVPGKPTSPSRDGRGCFYRFSRPRHSCIIILT